MVDARQRKANRRLGLVLASIVLIFFVGIIVRRLVLG